MITQVTIFYSFNDYLLCSERNKVLSISKSYCETARKKQHDDIICSGD